MSKFHRHDPRNKKKNKHKNQSKGGNIKRIKSVGNEWKNLAY